MLSWFGFLGFAALAAAAPVRDQAFIPRTLVNRSIYDKLALYAGYTQLSNTGVCAHPSIPGALYQFVESKDTDTQVSIWKVDAYKEFIIAIPGTSSARDNETNFDFALVPYKVNNVHCPSCRVHKGYQAAWRSVTEQVQGNLTSLLGIHPDYTVTLTGHSLGGGLVSIAFPNLRNGPYNVTQAYTYGQPRAGNSAFANYVDSISGASDVGAGIFYRVTHANDFIPKLPPSILGYKHSRTEYWESKPSMDNAASTYRCYGQEPADCNRNATGIDSKVHVTYAGMNVTCNMS
ncbi:Lipase, class 3 [Beauveria brongniartii RCEF 3172]|uniref:Lipase, class 3 n=1 Tax=Beauveria brongniartii RCEF 3172 TaxID=1081107 RepID=A0A167DTS7_9HYPO|nr:Lipase, class 3 [Beauveria brongniartii RCEF 3172]